MAGLGPTELLIVLGIILLLFGAARLPHLARSLGSAKREFEQGRGEPGQRSGRSPGRGVAAPSARRRLTPAATAAALLLAPASAAEGSSHPPPPVLPIGAVQGQTTDGEDGAPDASPYAGETVAVRGVVHSLTLTRSAWATPCRTTSRMPSSVATCQRTGARLGGMPPLPSGEKGSGASRVQTTTESGSGSPEATLRVNG